jgi:hypothetical protein
MLKQLKLKTGSEKIDCIICGESIQQMYFLRLSCRCQVRYHAACLDKWLTKSRTCVSCRKVISRGRFTRTQLRSSISRLRRIQKYYSSDQILSECYLPSEKRKYFQQKPRVIEHLVRKESEYRTILANTYVT